MSPVQTGAPPAEDAPATRSLRWRAVAAPVLQNKSALVALAMLAFFVFLAVFGDLLIAGDPKAKVGDVFEPPSREFWLGTDGGGASMLSLLIAGARVSLLIGFCAAAISAIIGGAITVEYVFSYPGIGLLIVEAIDQRDYSVLQGAFLLLTLSVIFFNLLADLLYFKLDPRVQE